MSPAASSRQRTWRAGIGHGLPGIGPLGGAGPLGGSWRPDDGAITPETFRRELRVLGGDSVVSARRARQVAARRALPSPDLTPTAQAVPGLRVHGGVGGTVALLEDLDRASAVVDDAVRYLTQIVSQCDVVAADAEDWSLLERSDLLRARTQAPGVGSALEGEVDLTLGRLTSRGAVAHDDAVACADRAAVVSAQVQDLAADLRRARAAYADADDAASALLRAVQGARTSTKHVLNASAPGLGSGTALLQAAALVGSAALADRLGSVVGLDAGAARRLAPHHDALVGDVAESVAMLAPPFGPAPGPGSAVPWLAQSVVPVVERLLGDRRATVTEYRAAGPQAHDPVGALEATERLYGRHGMRPGTIAVQRNELPGGQVRWVVLIPGTQGGLQEAHGFDNRSNVELMANDAAASARATVAAMTAAGIGHDEEVALVGHSQGGLAALAVAAHPDVVRRFRVRDVLTAGSPTANQPTRADVTYLHVESEQEIVPSLDGRHNPDVPNRTSVVYDLTRSGDPAVRALGADVASAHRLEAHAAALRSAKASDHPSVTAALDRLDGYFGTGRHHVPASDGVRTSVRYFQADATRAP